MPRVWSIFAGALLLVFVTSCSVPSLSTDPARRASTETVLAEIDALIKESIADSAFPGAVLAIGLRDSLYKLSAYGSYTYASERPTTPQSEFDLASLTKVIATTSVAMLLYEQGRLDLDATVRSYLPGFDEPGKADVTVRQLLTHTSGFEAFRSFVDEGVVTRQAVLDSIFAIALQTEPGEEYRYSDFGMITLLLVLEAIAGQDFASFVQENIFGPLGMASTGFKGVGVPDTSVVPTEVDTEFRSRLIQGEVHDERAWVLGGTAGHAGLFSTAEDVARFAAMLAQGGRIDTTQLFKPETVEYFTTVVDTSISSRALGWDTKSHDKPSSSGEYFGPRSFGHTGFTGTSMWVDPDTGVYVVLLTNRVHPTRDNRLIIDVRPRVADLAYEALLGLPRQ